MSGLRLLLFAMLAFVAWRLVQTTMRIMKNKKDDERQEDPFANYHPGASSGPDLDNIKDADFEDITPKDDEESKKPPDQ